MRLSLVIDTDGRSFDPSFQELARILEHVSKLLADNQAPNGALYDVHGVQVGTVSTIRRKPPRIPTRPM